MISRTCSYGLQAALFLARARGEREYVPVHQIASELQIPYFFLKKIMVRLTEFGITKSVRSSKGGISLAKQPADISIWEVMQAMGEAEHFELECFMHFPVCNEQEQCPFHQTWRSAREMLRTNFSQTSLLSGAAYITQMTRENSSEAGLVRSLVDVKELH